MSGIKKVTVRWTFGKQQIKSASVGKCASSSINNPKTVKFGEKTCGKGGERVQFYYTQEHAL